MPNGKVYYTSPSGTEWTVEKSQVAINQFHNIGMVLAGMERLTEHHALWTRKQIQAIGGHALWLRNIRQMRFMMTDSSHRELHANVHPVIFLPQEHARKAFAGILDLGLEYMGRLEAVDALARHMGTVSLRGSSSIQTQRIAQNLEQNLIEQRPYIIDGMI